jgi:hypothetical protein
VIRLISFSLSLVFHFFLFLLGFISALIQYNLMYIHNLFLLLKKKIQGINQQLQTNQQSSLFTMYNNNKSSIISKIKIDKKKLKFNNFN